MRNPFGRLFHRRDRDFDEIRSHVLNEKFSGGRLNEFEPYPPMLPQTPQQAPDFAQSGYEDFSPKTMDVFAPFPTQQPPMQPSPDFAPAAAGKVNRDYDIMDRLSLIESQLSAIRSQTELINERLKNMESRLGLGRRY